MKGKLMSREETVLTPAERRALADQIDRELKSAVREYLPPREAEAVIRRLDNESRLHRKNLNRKQALAQLNDAMARQSNAFRSQIDENNALVELLHRKF